VYSVRRNGPCTKSDTLPVGAAARPADREARAKDPRQDGTFGEPPPVPHKPKTLMATEARSKSAKATSAGAKTKPKSAATGSKSSAKVVKAARPVKPVNELLKEMHSDGTMFVPAFYRGED
jgi:hypothetical protein